MSYTRHTTRISFLLVFLFILLDFTSIYAQRYIKDTPISFTQKYQSVFSKDLKTNTISQINLARLKADDIANPSNRFAAPVDVNFDLQNDGDWYDLDDGGRVWRLKIKADGALGLFIFYKNFHLPNGARLYVYDENKKQLLGAYTNQNNSKHGKFMTGMIKGGNAVIEYYEPWYSRGQGNFEIYQVMQAYNRERIESDYPYQVYAGFGDGLPCHENVNCSWGDNLQDEKRGVGRILTVYNTGMGWCSGSLLNTTENDGTPYFLTAHHCGYLGANIADFSLWRFDFNYEHPSCNNEITEPNFLSVLGSEEVAGAQPSDFLLLKLLSNVPSSYNAYFNGWNRLDFEYPQAELIHHPFGDVKKISVDTNLVESWPFIINWSDNTVTPPHSHYRAVLDVGTIEGGSSGSPSFNPNGEVVGQLHGGVTSCTQFFTYEGKLSYSWSAGATPAERLKEWLDPNDTGVISVNGIENPIAATASNVMGNIVREDGTAITAVELQITGDTTLNINNETNGDYEVLDLENSQNYTLTPFRNDNPTNGVNTFDILLMRQHILGLGSPLTPYQIIAGDVNQNGDLNTFDIILVRRLILQLDTAFTNSNSWRFVDADYNFQDPTDPLNEPFPEAKIYMPILMSMPDQDFVAIKVGDVNNSAID